MAKKGMFIASFILGILLFAYVLNGAGISNVLKSFEMLSFYKYFLLISIYFSSYFINILRWNITLKMVHKNVKFSKLFSIRLSEWAVSYITPFARMGGEPVMAYLFKKECRLKYRKGISVIFVNKFMDFAGAIILAIIGVIAFLVLYSSYLPKKTSFVYILGTIFLSFLIYGFYFKLSRKQRVFSSMISPIKEWFDKKTRRGVRLVENELHKFFARKKSRMVEIFVISVIINLIVLLNLKMIGLFMGINLTTIQLLMIFAFQVFAFLIPTPGSLGSLEGSMALIFSLMGYGAGVGVAFALIWRSFEVIQTIMGVFFLFYYGIKLKGITKAKQKV